MGRKRKYNTAMEIEDAFRAPEGDESEVNRKRRMKNKTAALYRLRKRQEADLEAACGNEDTTTHMEDGDVSILSGDATEQVFEPANNLVSQEVPVDNRDVALDGQATAAQSRVRRPRRKADMSASQINEVRRIYREQKTAKRRQDATARKIHKQREQVRRHNMSTEERQAEQERNTASRASQRQEMSEDQRQLVQERDTNARTAARSQITEEEHLLHREAQRFRNRSRKYKKGYRNHEDFNPKIIRGRGTKDRRHYLSRFFMVVLEMSANALIATRGSSLEKRRNVVAKGEGLIAAASGSTGETAATLR